MYFLQGDTITSTKDELESIISNGKFCISESSQYGYDHELTLKFLLESKESSTDLSSLSGDPQQAMTVWNRIDIQDFIRRLGFANLEGTSNSLTEFVELNEVSIEYHMDIINGSTFVIEMFKNSTINAVTV